jgi:ABC-type transporter Mla subunit MlaD
MSNIELNYPKTPIKDNPVTWQAKYIVIPPAPSILQSAADSLTRILNQINKMDLNEAWSNVVETTSKTAQLIDNINDVVDSQKGNISAAMDDLREASSNIKDFSNEIRANPASLIKSSEAPVLNETL